MKYSLFHPIIRLSVWVLLMLLLVYIVKSEYHLLWLKSWEWSHSYHGALRLIAGAVDLQLLLWLWSGRFYVFLIMLDRSFSLTQSGSISLFFAGFALTSVSVALWLLLAVHCGCEYCVQLVVVLLVQSHNQVLSGDGLVLLLHLLQFLKIYLLSLSVWLHSWLRNTDVFLQNLLLQFLCFGPICQEGVLSWTVRGSGQRFSSDCLVRRGGNWLLWARRNLDLA